jgi:hypothetical protein
LPRLQDPEAYIIAGTLDAISALCANAGEFMRSRIEDAWQALGVVHARCRNGKGRAYPDPSKYNPMSLIKGLAAGPASTKTSSGLALYHVDSPSRIIWQSLVELLKSVVIHIAVSGDVFDDIVDMLLPVVEMRPDIRDALDSRNADAVWLALRRLKNAQQTVLGKTDEKPASIMTKPVGRHWRFAEGSG